MPVSRGDIILAYVENVGGPGGKVRPALVVQSNQCRCLLLTRSLVRLARVARRAPAGGAHTLAGCSESAKNSPGPGEPLLTRRHRRYAHHPLYAPRREGTMTGERKKSLSGNGTGMTPNTRGAAGHCGSRVRVAGSPATWMPSLPPGSPRSSTPVAALPSQPSPSGVCGWYCSPWRA